LPLDEIARLEALQGAEINEAKKVLAYILYDRTERMPISVEVHTSWTP
jgi:hypothetical protein